MLTHIIEADKFVEDEIVKLFKDWTQPTWDELDWAKMKELQTRDLLEQRDQEAKKAQLGHCFDCTSFVKHVSTSVLALWHGLTTFSSPCATMSG